MAGELAKCVAKVGVIYGMSWSRFCKTPNLSSTGIPTRGFRHPSRSEHSFSTDALFQQLGSKGVRGEMHRYLQEC